MKILKWFFGFTIVVTLVSAIVSGLRQAQLTPEEKAAEKVAQVTKANEKAAEDAAQATRAKAILKIGDMVVVKKMSWRLGGFDSVLVVDMTIENKSSLNLKDFVLSCSTKGASGTELSDTKKTLYESIPAGKTKSFRDISMGFVSSQSKKAGCEIISATPQDYK